MFRWLLFGVISFVFLDQGFALETLTFNLSLDFLRGSRLHALGRFKQGSRLSLSFRVHHGFDRG